MYTSRKIPTHVRLLQHWCCESDKDNMYLCVHGSELHQSYTEVMSSGLVSVPYPHPAPHRTRTRTRVPWTQGSLRYVTALTLSEGVHHYHVNRENYLKKKQVPCTKGPSARSVPGCTVLLFDLS